MAKAIREENIRVTMELFNLTHQVVSTLRADFESSSGVFPVQRYEMLKTMIKSAIQASRPDNLEKLIKTRKFGDTTRALQFIEDTKRELMGMSKEAIEADTATKRRDTEIIRGLETDYATSKRLFPVRRYFEMKRMVRLRLRRRAEMV